MRLKEKLEALQKEYDALLHTHQKFLTEYDWMRNHNRSLQRQREEFIQTLRPILSLLQSAADNLSGSNSPTESYPSRLGEASDRPQCSAENEVGSGFTAYRRVMHDTDLPKPTTKWIADLPGTEAPFVQPSKGRQSGPQRSAKSAPSKAKSKARSLSATRAWETRRRNSKKLKSAQKKLSKPAVRLK